MPNTVSAKKRVRQNARRRSLNLWRKRRIKVQVRDFLTAIQEQKVDQAETEFRKVCSLLDRMSCTPTLHRNFAARQKSRLCRRLKTLKQRLATT